MSGRLTLDELIDRYTTLVYHQAGSSYVAAAQRLGMDRRTVKARIDHEYLAELQGSADDP